MYLCKPEISCYSFWIKIGGCTSFFCSAQKALAELFCYFQRITVSAMTIHLFRKKHALTSSLQSLIHSEILSWDCPTQENPHTQTHTVSHPAIILGLIRVGVGEKVKVLVFYSHFSISTGTFDTDGILGNFESVSTTFGCCRLYIIITKCLPSQNWEMQSRLAIVKYVNHFTWSLLYSVWQNYAVKPRSLTGDLQQIVV